MKLVDSGQKRSSRLPLPKRIAFSSILAVLMITALELASFVGYTAK